MIEYKMLIWRRRWLGIRRLGKGYTALQGRDEEGFSEQAPVQMERKETLLRETPKNWM